jgi:hypothetical protein
MRCHFLVKSYQNYIHIQGYIPFSTIFCRYRPVVVTADNTPISNKKNHDAQGYQERGETDSTHPNLKTHAPKQKKPINPVYQETIDKKVNVKIQTI